LTPISKDDPSFGRKLRQIFILLPLIISISKFTAKINDKFQTFSFSLFGVIFFVFLSGGELNKKTVLTNTPGKQAILINTPKNS